MPFIEITVTVPSSIMNAQRVVDEIRRTQDTVTALRLTQYFRQTVEGWKTPPGFAQQREDTSDQLGVKVYPIGGEAEKYALINAGARPHFIRPRRTNFLRFQTGYRAGTAPRVLRSRAYSRFGPMVGAAEVRHPGFEAREFTQTIADTHEPEFNKDMQDAITRGSANP